jgi:WD40 repeat protein/mono/diheme cytochrome c family protein
MRLRSFIAQVGMSPRRALGSLAFALCAGLSLLVVASASSAAESAEAVSYHKQVKPIFQAHCQGCHQPAKAEGGFEMTVFAQLLKGGDSGSAAVVASKPEASYLLELITPENGKAEMPRGKEPLSATDIETITKWIAQGAKDDTPANAVAKYDADHPPVYPRAPVVPALDYSPDGKLLAVAGFHEVLLHRADGSALVARLVGMSERIESLKFSPDGKRLAVTGGLPGRLGEIQVWDVDSKELVLSHPVTFDTVYGASWSPDGKLIACGCGDNSVRVIDAATGKQKLFMGSHNDWVLDTVFSVDGSHLISVSRDRSAKLTEVETERFIDNITSITPGALKGGLQAVTRHPTRDEIVFGGADGVPKIYRVHRITKRVIGDDANLISVLPALKGRIFGVDVSRDGKRIAACSSSDGTGEIGLYTYADDTSVPDNIKEILEKRAGTATEAELKLVDEHTKKSVKQLAKIAVPETGLFAVAFSPDGKQVAAAGSDGEIRLFDAADGKLVRTFTSVPLAKQTVTKQGPAKAKLVFAGPQLPTETLPKNAEVVALEVQPSAIELKNRFDYVQLIVTAKLKDGTTLDVSRGVKFAVAAGKAEVPAAEVLPGGLVVPRGDGKGTIAVSIGGHEAAVPYNVTGTDAPYPVDYLRDVNPVLTRLGCNQGTCHGAKDGKNGFKLSLRGYDAVYDLRAFTDDHASRRVNPAAPDQSLMLLKATGSVPHVGGQLTKPGETNYAILRSWIADGAKVNLKTPRVVSIEVLPPNPVIDRPGQKQQMRILARYADGRLRDVTREAFIESGNIEVAATFGNGILIAQRRGEAPILARFEGSYAASTLTVMGDRSGFQWVEPPKNNRIDELTAAKWKQVKTLPSELCTDAEFIRRVSIDLTGLPPTAAETQAFLADKTETRKKRDALVDKLIGSDPFVEHWTNKWADLLQVNPKFLGADGAKLLRDWIRKEVAENRPYDQFVREILTADGSNRENPAASYFKILRDPANMMENTTHLFLAVRFNCNKCHDHPFERWTQDQYYQTAAYFAQIQLSADPAAKGAVLGATAVEKGKPAFEIIADMPKGEMTHERTGLVTAPKFPFPAKHETKQAATRREELASWMTSPDNAYFARSYVNRLWGYLFGIGIMEPIDDIRAGNPPTNPELISYLTDEFVKNGFDARKILALICKSRTYQLSVATNKWNADDKINYSHSTARRLPAEVLYDAIHRVTGSQSRFPGYPVGTRAAQLTAADGTMGAGFLQTFGRPVRESACECERAGGMALGPVMAMISGPTLADAVADPKNDLTKLAKEQKDDAKLVDELFLRVLNRPATKEEVALALETIGQVKADDAALAKKLAEREAEWKPILAKKEKERQAAVAAATKALKDYEKSQAAAVAEAEKKRTEAIAAAEAALAVADHRRTYEQAAWEAKLEVTPETVLWQPLTIASALPRASTSIKYHIEADGSTIYAEGAEIAYDITNVVAETTLANVTAVMLEVLPDERLPDFGPGYGKRNFVLTEIVLKDSYPLGEKDEEPKSPSTFSDAIATATQEKFDVKQAFDGKMEVGPTNGWATNGKPGVQRAAFQLQKPLASKTGHVLKIDLVQFYKPGYMMGKFRLWVTDAKKPLTANQPPTVDIDAAGTKAPPAAAAAAKKPRQVPAAKPRAAKGESSNVVSFEKLGLPAGLVAAVKKPADKRTAADWAALDDYQRIVDENYVKQELALWTARKPLPVDPKLVELQEKLARAELPVPVDPQLVQLRADAEMSKAQAADARLTVVQDLAWALMNSPAFLFNR